MVDSSLDDLAEGGTERAKLPQKEWSAEDRKVLIQAVLRGSLVIIAAIAAMSLPETDSDTLAALIGGTAILIAVGTVIMEVGWRTSHAGSTFTLLGQAAGLAIVGVLLMVWPGATLEVVGRVLGIAVVGLGLLSTARGLIVGGPHRTWWLARGVLLILTGGFALLFPDATAMLLLWALAISWAVAAITSAVALLLNQPRPDMYPEPVEPHRLAADWLRRYEMDGAQREAVSEKLFFEGATFRGRLWRFAVLMFLSTTIATFGVGSDSTAVVIGAMLIAPLMTPIMGLTGALVMAWPRRAIRAGAVVLGGIAIALVVSWAITGLSPQISETVLTSSQVTSRVNPTLIDLGIALAAGAAGAFAISRPDVADSLPGVAIAVALVPPLSVVGTTVQLGAWADARGASLLFLTNLVAIILAGGSVFILTGFSPMNRISTEGARIRVSFAAVGVMMLMILVPLALTTRSILEDSLGADDAQGSVADWAEGTNLQIVTVEVNGSEVDVFLTGDDPIPQISELGGDLESSLGRAVDVTVRVIPSRTTTYQSQD